MRTKQTITNTRLTKIKRKRGITDKRKILYARDDNSSSNEDDSDSQEVLFLAMGSKHEPYDNGNEYCEDFTNEVEVDFEGGFICSRNELEKLRKKNTLLKEQLKGIKGHPESIDEEDITSLRK